MTAKERIIQLLAESALTSKEIQQQLSDLRYSSIRRCLNKLKNQGLIRRDGGKYYLQSVADTVVEQVEKLEVSSLLTDDESVVYERKIQNLTDELSRLKRMYKASHRTNSLQDSIIQAIKDYCPQLQPVPAIRLDKPVKDGLEETAVLMFSDPHFWDEIIFNQTGGLNEYNMDIACEYMQSLATKMIKILKENHAQTKIDTLHIFMLGDMITGLIHGLMEHSPATVISAKLEAGLLVSCFVRDLSRYFKNVYVSCVVGNHGRLTQQKRYKWRVEDNFDYDLYNQVAVSLLNYPNVHFNIPTSFWMITQIYQWDFLLLHGDDIRSWNQIPWYGILRALTKFQELLAAESLHFDFCCLGHFHNAGFLDRCRGEILLNGSLEGTSDFSLGALFTGNQPKQMFFGVHEHVGVSWRYPILVERLKPDTERIYRIDKSKQIHQAIIEAMA